MNSEHFWRLPNSSFIKFDCIIYKTQMTIKQQIPINLNVHTHTRTPTEQSIFVFGFWCHSSQIKYLNQHYAEQQIRLNLQFVENSVEILRSNNIDLLTIWAEQENGKKTDAENEMRQPPNSLGQTNSGECCDFLRWKSFNIISIANNASKLVTIFFSHLTTLQNVGNCASEWPICKLK